MKRFFIICCACIVVGSVGGYLVGSQLVPSLKRNDPQSGIPLGTDKREGIKSKYVSKDDELSMFLWLQGTLTSEQLKSKFEKLHEEINAHEGRDAIERLKLLLIFCSSGMKK